MGKGEGVERKRGSGSVASALPPICYGIHAGDNFLLLGGREAAHGQIRGLIGAGLKRAAEGVRSAGNTKSTCRRAHAFCV